MSVNSLAGDRDLELLRDHPGHRVLQVRAGRLAPARAYVQALPGWFATHLATMDAALAGCLKRSRG